jgi:hypothetical protein
VDFPLRHRDPLKHGQGFGFNPFRKAAAGDQLADVGITSAMLMLMFVFMCMCVTVVVFVGVRVTMFVFIFMLVLMLMTVVVVLMTFFVRVRVVMMTQMHVKLRPFDLRTLRARDMQMVSVHGQLGQFALQVGKPHSKVEHRADKHIAAQSAENIQIKRFH